MKVREIMSEPVLTCRSTDSLAQAAQLMWEHDCGAVPVLDGDDRLVGMITDRDICMACYTQGKPLWEMLVVLAMAKKVVSCRADDGIGVVEQLMREHQIRRLPVVDEDGELVGLLSLSDLARSAGTTGREYGLAGIVTHTLATICRPNNVEVHTSRMGDGRLSTSAPSNLAERFGMTAPNPFVVHRAEH
ncbi:MAG: CBS domain-containing protein [Myxococcota bacterium]